MPEHDLEKLLGGFAADTLTAEERTLLYTAALQDQRLFNAMADEQALKELLADPAVRRNLLHALAQTRPSDAGGSLSWPDWFRRPAGLAFAGGLAATALAVILGTKIYQDSLTHTAQSVATKHTTPAASPASPTPPFPPPTAEPEGRAKDKAAPLPQAPTKEAVKDSRAKRKEPAKLSASADHPVKDPARKNGLVHLETDESRRHDSTRPARPSHAMEEPTAPADTRQQEPSAAPSTTTPTPQLPVNVPFASAGASGPSARALFYKTATEPAVDQEHRPQPAAAEEKLDTGKMAEAPMRAKKRTERSIGVLGNLERAKPSFERPLGLRYSLIMTGPGGIDMEVDPATPVGKDDVPRLAVQTNEDGYLSVLYTRQSSGQSTVLFPSSGDGRIAGRKPVAIVLANVFDVPQTSEQVRLLVVFSRTPRDGNSAQPTEKNVSRPLIEQVDPSQPGAPAEQAVYTISPDPTSAATLSIEIALSLRP